MRIAQRRGPRTRYPPWSANRLPTTTSASARASTSGRDAARIVLAVRVELHHAVVTGPDGVQEAGPHRPAHPDPEREP